MKRLIRQIEATFEFTNGRCASISFLPNDPAATSFLEDEKKSGASPLSKYVTTLRERAQQRNDSLMESSVLVGAHSSVFKKQLSESDEENDTKNEEGAAVFSSSWLPGSDSKANHPKEDKKRKGKKNKDNQDEVALDEDVIEDLILSSDEDGSASDTPSAGKDVKAKPVPLKQQSKRRKPSTDLPKKNLQFRANKSKKRKKAN